MKLHLTLAAMALAATPALAETYNMQSAFGTGLPVLGPAADRFVANVATLTGGEVTFKHLGAGEMSPPFEIFNNVGVGAIEAGWSFAAYASGE